MVNEIIQVTNQQIYYKTSQVMIKVKDNRLINGNNGERVGYEISKGPMITYLMGGKEAGRGNI